MFNVWNNVLAEVERKISREKYATYLQKTTLESIDNGEIKIGVPNVFMSVNVKKNFDELIIEALKNNNIEVKSTEYVIKEQKNIVKKPREVSFSEDNKQESYKKPASSRSFSKTNTPINTGLRPDFTFDNFVVGTNNDLAYAMARNVVKAPGVAKNPFFIYGKSGLGKTHLVQAIGNEILRNNPSANILYVPINHFYQDYLDSVKSNNFDKFRKKYANLDILIIDDFQLISGKEKSQEEFFNLFNDMHLSNRQVIITSDRLPSEIKDVDVRLASRITMTGPYDIQYPSFEDRCAILTAKADFNGVEIEREAIEYIAENVKTNIRDLNSEYEKLIAFAELRNVTPLEIIRAGFGTATKTEHRATTPKKVITKVAKFYGMEVSLMLSKSRVANIKNARQIAMYLMRNELGLSLPKIASEIGMKDHTTILNGTKRIESDLKMNYKLRDDIEQLREIIYE